ncbi:hypothetical protein PH586_22830 [Pseudomonas sp. SA3-5]|uniref:Uncharacterized protein n=1 Tax=Pseudomonas aestuarii TaxID=3018340 RepID=A0ABT4XM83_9PSED|nr:hypothetical protein [Pseudomonas aestuarii]MDA7089218.1 hypothetical protein [Pseudomonas aestuarii]
MFALQAAQTVAQGALEFDRWLALDQAVAAVAVELFAGRAGAGLLRGVELKVGGCIALAGARLGAFVPERVGFVQVLFLPCIARIALAVAVVWDKGRDGGGFQSL